MHVRTQFSGFLLARHDLVNVESAAKW